MKYTIFSIDGVERTDNLRKFLNFILENKAYDNIKHNCIQCIGSYKGELELSFIMRISDFKVVVDAGFVDGEESFVEFSECNKRYADLVWKDGVRQGLGSLKSVTKEEAMKHDSWTYRPDMNTYWITVKGNPDTVVS